MGGFRAFAAIYLYKYNPANDTSIKKKIFSAWEKNHPKRTGMVHVSDLSYCFRKSVFSRTDMNPLPGATQTVIVAGNINGGGRQVQTLQGAPPFFKIDGAVVELKISV